MRLALSSTERVLKWMLRRLLDLFVLGIEDLLFEVEVLLCQLVEGRRPRSGKTVSSCLREMRRQFSSGSK